jgi:hypothetical protein
LTLNVQRLPNTHRQLGKDGGLVGQRGRLCGKAHGTKVGLAQKPGQSIPLGLPKGGQLGVLGPPRPQPAEVLISHKQAEVPPDVAVPVVLTFVCDVTNVGGREGGVQNRF